jgi:hypothetical protein
MNDDCNHLTGWGDGAKTVGLAGAQWPAERFQSDRAHNGQDFVRWQRGRSAGIKDLLCPNRGGLSANKQRDGRTGCEIRKARFHEHLR